MSLNLGKNIEMNKIKEGEDIYLECSVDSRPEPYKLFFKLQVKCKSIRLVHSNIGRYLIFSHESDSGDSVVSLFVRP